MGKIGSAKLGDSRRLLYDLWKAQPNRDSKYHGGGEYMKSLLQSFLLKHGHDANIDVFYDMNRFMDDWVVSLLKEYGVRIRHVSRNSELKEILAAGEYCCLYSGLPLDYDREIIPDSVHFIGTVHGIRFAETPTDQYEYKYYSGLRKIKHWTNRFRTESLRERFTSQVKSRLSVLDEVICDSAHTMYAIGSLAGIPAESLHLAYCPPQQADKPEVPELLMKEVSGRKIILMISCGRWIKNAYRAFIALDRLFENGLLAEYIVVCCGLNNSDLLRSLRNSDRFLITGYVSSSHLQYLYGACDLFLYPTLNEGFGLPPLEVLKNGGTCILSGVCSLPELYGDAAYYVNPYSIEEIATRVLQAANDPLPENLCVSKYNELHHRQCEGERDLVQLLLRWAV